MGSEVDMGIFGELGKGKGGADVPEHKRRKRREGMEKPKDILLVVRPMLGAG